MQDIYRWCNRCNQYRLQASFTGGYLCKCGCINPCFEEEEEVVSLTAPSFGVLIQVGL